MLQVFNEEHKILSGRCQRPPTDNIISGEKQGGPLSNFIVKWVLYWPTMLIPSCLYGEYPLKPLYKSFFLPYPSRYLFVRFFPVCFFFFFFFFSLHIKQYNTLLLDCLLHHLVFWHSKRAIACGIAAVFKKRSFTSVRVSEVTVLVFALVAKATIFFNRMIESAVQTSAVVASATSNTRS